MSGEAPYQIWRQEIVPAHQCIEELISYLPQRWDKYMYQLTARRIKPGAYERLVLCCQLVYTCPTFVAPLYIHELAQFPIIVFFILSVNSSILLQSYLSID